MPVIKHIVLGSPRKIKALCGELTSPFSDHVKGDTWTVNCPMCKSRLRRLEREQKRRIY